MADTFAVCAPESLNAHAKGKKHHRRTQSTLNLEIEGLTPKAVKKDEIMQEFLQAPDTLDADITQKILDVSIDLNSDRQVVVDDINEIPSKGAIVPKLNFNVNPLAFNKRRNLSAATPPINNCCPIRKIDLFSNLQHIDNLTGLDTIYEKRGSIESVDIETIEARQSARAIEQNMNKPLRECFKEIKSNHSKHPSADLPDTHSGQAQLISVEEKRTHSRQSSADQAYSRLNQAGKEQSIKFMKPTHSKHSSIDLNRRNSKQGKAEISLNPTPTANRTNPLKPSHNKQCSLNFSPSHVKQQSISIQPTSTSRLNRNNNKSHTYHQNGALNTNMSDPERAGKTVKKSQKKSFETYNFFIMPSRNNEPVPKSPKNKSLLVERNKFITELQKVSMEQMKAKKMRENVTPQSHAGKHERNISSTSRTTAAPKHIDQQKARVQQKPLSGFQERGFNKSISPMRNVSNISTHSDSKQQGQARNKRAEIRSFKEVINCRAMPLSEERVNTIDVMQSRAPYNPKSLYPENPIDHLVEKTNALEGQVTDILQVVSAFMTEEVQLKEKIKTQEDQIKTLEDMLVQYEREVNTLKAGVICKTEPCDGTKTWMRKDKSETRLLTTTDTSAYESCMTENSGRQLLSKTSRRNRKISPFTIHVGGGSNIQSAKNEARKINEGLLSEYKNLMKKRQLTQKKVPKH